MVSAESSWRGWRASRPSGAAPGSSIPCRSSSSRTAGKGRRGALTDRGDSAYAAIVEVHLNPELERKLTELAAKTGLAPERLLEEAVAAYGASRLATLDWSQCPVVESVPGKLSGAWVLRGTRMPVATIFQNLEAGANIDDVLEWYDGLDREQVKAVIEFAVRSLETSTPTR